MQELCRYFAFPRILHSRKCPECKHYVGISHFQGPYIPGNTQNGSIIKVFSISEDPAWAPRSSRNVARMDCFTHTPQALWRHSAFLSAQATRIAQNASIIVGICVSEHPAWGRVARMQALQRYFACSAEAPGIVQKCKDYVGILHFRRSGVGASRGI